MSEWISVEDRLPEDRKAVLFTIVLQRMVGGSFAEDEIVILGWIEDGHWLVGNQMLLWDFDYNLNFVPDDVTHWMPLPNPPKDKE